MLVNRTGPDGLTGDITEESRPLKEGETMEWVLVSGVSSIEPVECFDLIESDDRRHPQHAPTSHCTTYTQERSTWSCQDLTVRMRRSEPIRPS